MDLDQSADAFLVREPCPVNSVQVFVPATLALGFYKRLRASLEERTVEDPKTRADLAMAYHRMATISGRLGAHDEAREAFRVAIALRE